MKNVSFIAKAQPGAALHGGAAIGQLPHGIAAADGQLLGLISADGGIFAIGVEAGVTSLLAPAWEESVRDWKI